jgi:hypothetical protein
MLRATKVRGVAILTMPADGMRHDRVRATNRGVPSHGVPAGIAGVGSGQFDAPMLSVVRSNEK